jgi:AraC-like DNA-binding protein
MKNSLTTDQKLISELTQIILNNLGNESFSVSDFAKASGMSVYTLKRKLFSATKKTVHQFIHETRLLKAMEMLKNEDVTASEVAYKTGFSSPAHFNTSFHKLFGFPPGKAKSFISADSEENILSTDDFKQSQQRFSWRIIGITTGVGLALFIIIYLVYITVNKINPERSIAVLPFRNLSNDSTDQYV